MFQTTNQLMIKKPSKKLGSTSPPCLSRTVTAGAGSTACVKSMEGTPVGWAITNLLIQFYGGYTLWSFNIAIENGERMK